MRKMAVGLDSAAEAELEWEKGCLKIVQGTDFQIKCFVCSRGCM